MTTWTIQLSSVGHKTYNFLLWSKGLSIMPCASFSFHLPSTGNPDIHHTTPDSSRACLCFSQPQEAGLRTSRETARQLHLTQPRCRAQWNLSSCTSIYFSICTILFRQHCKSLLLFRASKMIWFTPRWSERGAFSMGSEHAGAKEVIASYSAQTQLEKHLLIQYLRRLKF